MALNNDFTKVNIKAKKGENPNKPLLSEQGIWSVIIVIGVLIFTMLLVAIAGPNSFILFVGDLFLTPIATFANFGDFLGELAWLIIVGLSLMVSFRVGVFNIGVFAQFIGGAMCGYAVALAFGGPGWMGVILVLLVAVLAGAIIGWIIAKLKTTFGIHEVLTSIMLNWIVLYLVTFLTAPGSSITFFTPAGELGPQSITQNLLTWEGANNFFGSTFFNYGVPISLVLIFVFWFMYKKTIWGYKQDILGSNISVGDYVGINKEREWEKSITISGALAGLAGVIYYLSFKGNVSILVAADLPMEAFLGITVALLGFCNPIGILFSSILIAYLTSSQELIYGIFQIDIIGFILALLIFLLSMVNFFIIVRPQERFKKNLVDVPWEDYEVDVPQNSKYVSLIEDNLNYDMYDIKEAEAYITYYENRIDFFTQQFNNEINEGVASPKKISSLRNKKDRKIKKCKKTIISYQKEIESISKKLCTKNQKLYEKHLKCVSKKEKNIIHNLHEQTEELELESKIEQDKAGAIAFKLLQNENELLLKSKLSNAEAGRKNSKSVRGNK